MNNNNRGTNNNRRRGRGNRPGGSNGGQQLNRIDSRARGNAPQLLEKYRKLAQDAHLNGDRVQAEYYLQFADHYFRVLADQRVRQDDQRTRQPGERWQEEGGDGDDGGDYAPVSDFPSFDQPSYSRTQRDEQPRTERQERPERQDRPERQERPARQDRPERQERPERQDRSEPEPEEVEAAEVPVAVEEGGDANPYEPTENPFVRENRSRGGLRPRRERDDRRPRRDEADSDGPVGLDPNLLPPAISVTRDDDGPAESEAEAKPRKRAVRRKPSAGDAGEAVESVN